ncbi:MAG: alpha-galactosidase [Lachnospiraceae bacterium]|nr:alpha-galactosidase [Lachnospiraceae bacterium]
MNGMRAYLNLSNGERQEFQVKLTEKTKGDVHAVYLDGFANCALDAEFGAGIEIEIDQVKRWMADYRHSEFWCRPKFGTEISEIPDETQGLIYEKENGQYGVILPVVSEKYKCVLAGGTENQLQAKLFSWYEGLVTCKALAFLWAEGDDPYAMLEACSKVGLELLGTGYRTRKERRYPEIFEYLGWCSWDAFEIRVDEAGLLAKCEEFKKKEIPVRWAIIDDMWGEVRDFYDVEYKKRPEMFRLMHSSKLYSFKADPRRFPNGLKHCIEKINEYGLKVGMWHPTTGYWMGIDPEGEVFRDYRDCLIQAEDGRYIHSPEKEKAYRFYAAFHDYLRQCGAEFIKIDNQSMSRRYYKKLAPVGEAARQFHDAMEASVGQHFDNQMINCMGMASEDMWNRSVSPISRCSDDFLPENKAWFTKHAMQCAYNCLIQGQFYYCDWDMWWTDDGQAEKNSILRAISGGPIYFSDTLDRSRAEVLKPLVLADGRILRCDRPAMPTKDCLTENPVDSGKVFKLWNTCNGCGVVAAFNLDKEENAVVGTISPKDVIGLSGEEFAVYEHFTKELKILNADEGFEITLETGDEYRLYTIVPLRDGCGMIGRTDKFISPATYQYTKTGVAELKEEGPFAYVENYQLRFA